MGKGDKILALIHFKIYYLYLVFLDQPAVVIWGEREVKVFRSSARQEKLDKLFQLFALSEANRTVGVDGADAGAGNDGGVVEKDTGAGSDAGDL